MRSVEPVLGAGLLLAEGEHWRRQRRIVQPAFQRAKLGAYAEVVLEQAGALVAAWRDGEVRELYADAAEFTLRVAARTLFGANLTSEAERARAALTEALEAFDQHLRARVPLPLALPSRSGRRLRRAGRALEELAYDFIAQRERTGSERDDLLSLLLSARHEGGGALSRRQIRDEVITAFAAGAETSATALAFTLDLLARHPRAAEQVRSELLQARSRDRRSYPRPAEQHCPQDLLELPFTDCVIKESLRLFPPAWVITRDVLRDCRVGGFHIPGGTQLFACTYFIQRDARYFPQPERFIPERWMIDARGSARELSCMRDLPKFAYFPFGGGQRMCVGNAFALMEIKLALATILPRVRFEPVGPPPELQAGFTLRARCGVPLRVFHQQLLPDRVHAHPSATSDRFD
jgi:cytochrome P450